MKGMKKKLSVRRVSEETSRLVEKGKRRQVFAFLPIAHPKSQDVKDFISQWHEKLGKMNERAVANLREQVPYIEYVANPERYKKYIVHCKECDAKVALVYASDETLSDWSHFHWISEHDQDFWYGCITPQISPADRRLAFECCCGNDSRDFREKFDAPQAMRNKNTTARLFGNNDSKFYAKLLK